MAHSLVIGGTRGLGRVVARMFSERGDTVSVIGRQIPQGVEGDRPDIRYYAVDILDTGEIEQGLERIFEQTQKLNYLVFCQRYRGQGQAWEGELEVSLSATKRIVEAVQSRFETGSDNAIAIVSSVFAHAVGEGQPISYHVAKAGMVQMMHYYAVNLGRLSIRVNAVTPATYLKDESKDFYLENPPLLQLYKDIIPLSRMGTAEEIARAIIFLCSSSASFVNGQNLFVDGGLSLVWPETLARKLQSL